MPSFKLTIRWEFKSRSRFTGVTITFTLLALLGPMAVAKAKGVKPSGPAPFVAFATSPTNPAAFLPASSPGFLPASSPPNAPVIAPAAAPAIAPVKLPLTAFCMLAAASQNLSAESIAPVLVPGASGAYPVCPTGPEGFTPVGAEGT